MDKPGKRVESCLFCRIIQKQIPSTAVYDDPDIFAFRDINPVAPDHILVCPKKHIVNVATLDGADDYELVSRVFRVLNRLSHELKLSDRGFRVVVNSGRDAQQSVDHMHFHLIAGRAFTWPPG